MSFEFIGKLLSAMLNGVAILYWVVLVVLLVGIARSDMARFAKVIVSVFLAVIMIGWPVREEVLLHQQQQAGRARLAKAEAIFEERCKTAGEKIYRTVEGVEGLLLMRVRPIDENFGEQYKMDDPYGDDLGGDGYIETFLRARDEKGHLATTVVGGYRYVDVIDATDGKRYRYTGSMKVVGRKNPNTSNHQVELARNSSFDLNNYAFMLDRVPAPILAPRYGVTYDDISTLDDREYWIAGSSLRIIDLQTNEVIAERIGYMMDRGQGAIGQGGSHPAWGRARKHACPSHPAPHQARNFVEKSLKTIKGK